MDIHPKNVKTFVTFPANKGQNASLMAVIWLQGVIAFEIIDGACDGIRFINFLNEHILPFFQAYRNFVLVMDNAHFHHRADALALLSQNGITYEFLPPCSPMLNPIEEFFGELKANYRALKPLSKTRTEIKEKVRSLLIGRTGDFAGNYRRTYELLPAASAGHPFL